MPKDGKPILYLHVGTPKTGTSAIQVFCRDNVEVLQKNGYDYPMFDTGFDHVGRHRNGHFLISNMIEDGKENIEKQKEVRAEGFKKVEEAFKRYRNVILSDEGIWHAAVYRKNVKDVWQIIKNHAEKCGYQVKIIVYLRRQDRMAVSWLNQQIKEGQNTFRAMTWQQFLDGKKRVILDYYSQLENIAAVYGKDNIIVRVYEKERFEGGRIESDFLKCVGLEMGDEYKIKTGRENPSLPTRLCEIWRIMNTMQYDQNYLRKIADTQRACEEFENSMSKVSMISREERKIFLEKYQKSNEKVAREYLGFEDGILFRDKIEDTDRWDADMSGMLQLSIRFFSEMINRQEEEISRQEDEIKELRKIVSRHERNLKDIKNPFRFVSRKIKGRK